MDVESKELFYQIWMNYHMQMPIEIYEYDNYAKLMKCFKDGTIDFTECKTDFIELIQTLAFTVYRHKYADNPYDDEDEDFEEERDYEFDKELNCCYRIKSWVTSTV